ncbi:MAG: Arm DNA-binding domain-containing protein [Deltaproteobacteria bacterium]|nr:Arm DNA-binding domain-containing protein [Deltaproteobacteria bacterium]
MLTHKQIENAGPHDKAYKLYDVGGLVLYLEVKPTGSRLWRLQYTFQDRRLLKSLGAWPRISLREAREQAAAFKKDIAGGINPVQEKDEPKTLFRIEAKEWADRFLPGLAEITRRQTLAKLDHKILPAIGGCRLEEITPPIVLNEVLRPIEAEGKLETLYSVKTILSQIFRYAVVNGLMERDFTLDLEDRGKNGKTRADEHQLTGGIHGGIHPSVLPGTGQGCGGDWFFRSGGFGNCFGLGGLRLPFVTGNDRLPQDGTKTSLSPLRPPRWPQRTCFSEEPPFSGRAADGRVVSEAGGRGRRA